MGLFLKLLGLIDLTTAAILFLATTSIIPPRITLTIAAALAIKGVFFRDAVSWFDVILACYTAFTVIANIKLLSILLGVYILIKGAYSML